MGKIAVVNALQPGARRWAQFFRMEDFIWLVLFSALAVFNTEKNYPAIIILVVMAIFQVGEPKTHLFASPRGRIAASTVKLALAWLLLGFTDGLQSPYYPVLFFPIISAATNLELAGTVAFILLSCASYISFLAFLDWKQFDLTTEARYLLCLRCIFPSAVGFLVYQQARAKREEMGRSEEANRNLRRAEASLRRSERLAALGQLTAGLAHELRNPLGTIKASAELMTKAGTQNNPAVMAEMAGYISSEVDRTSNLISRFLNFARPLEVHPEPADVVAIVDEAIQNNLEQAEARGVHLKREAPVSELPFVGDPHLLLLALQNLIQNAVQASNAGQTVRVSAASSDSQVVLRIQDEGAGIAPEQMENIFNPFFTTKPGGVGLGLALVSKIVDEHGGRIVVQSEPGKGAAFELLLPREAPASGGRDPIKNVLGGRGSGAKQEGN
jgi:two-component system, NtrC family, sensor histidine kinase HydH